MKAAVISDLHLGRGDTTDLFGHHDDEFVRFLRFLEDNHEQVILLGDVYETFGSNPWQQYREVERIREAHPEIVKRFESPQYTFVHGNHDVVMKRFGAPSELAIEDHGTRIVLRHGHQFDWWIRNLPVVPEFFVWVGILMARWGINAFYRIGEFLDVCLRKAEGPTPFQDWALAVAAQKSADVIVTAHTHFGTALETGNRFFMNSGACYKGRFSWLHLDTATGTYLHNTGW
jgi:predicted phosphodiesterase